MVFQKNNTRRDQVLTLRKAGYTYWEIAQRLNIQPSLCAYYGNDGYTAHKKRMQKKKLLDKNKEI